MNHTGYCPVTRKQEHIVYTTISCRTHDIPNILVKGCVESCSAKGPVEGLCNHCQVFIDAPAKYIG